MSPQLVSGADTPIPGGLTARWRLHRGGIVNIWQYAETEFDFSGGRAIFQGTNGSGKSRTLELLLPLCLDGDLRQMGSKGFDTVSIRRLMLDEYPGTQPNRIGYAWIELHRTAEDGGDEFLTCGIGVKASRTAQAISDSWRFITSRRVGVDLHLADEDRYPLSAAALREELGPECVLDDEAFRAKVASVVYGVPAERYSDLLHLQRTLRNPDVGLRVQNQQLEQILSDALPPLDSSLIERLATSFDDLESIRENIVRLSGADEALRRFLACYSDYALGSLQERAGKMRKADERLSALRGELAELQRKLATEQEQAAEAQRTVAELEQREAELETSIEALRSHPAYGELQNLRDRERLVESTRAAALSALDTASKHRAQEHRSAEAVVNVLRRLVTDNQAAANAASRTAGQLDAAGLDSSLVPAPPAPPNAELRVKTERVRTSPNPDAEPVTIERYLVPQLDTDGFAQQYRALLDNYDQVAALARQQAALTLTLHQQAQELDAEHSRIGELHRAARQAQLAATEESGRRHQARQQLREAAAAWAARAADWAHDWPGEAEPPEPPAPEQLVADRNATRYARDDVRLWARPQLQQARRRAAQLEQELAALEADREQHQRELAELQAGGERVPGRPEWATADRDPERGRAFYQLVDFQPGLEEAERAGLEAALQASGLLNAWVSADGEVTGVPDLFAAPRAAASGGTLADLLVPAADADNPVPQERVAELLRAVSTDGSGTFSVSTSGRWRSGVLSGQWRKSTAEFIGAGARHAARQRRIAELEDELERLNADIAAAEQRHREAGEHALALERHLDSYPDDNELLTAHVQLASAVDAAEAAEQQAAELREQHEQARQRWQAAHADLVRAAGEAGLPAETQLLQAANRAANDALTCLDLLREAVETRCLPTVAELRDICLHHDVAVADRMEAESQAEQRCAEYAEQAAALAELTAAVDGEAKDITERASSYEQERADLRRRLPKARQELTKLQVSAGKLENRLDDRQAALEERQSLASAASEEFRRALRLPGFWRACGLGDEVPDDLVKAGELVLDAPQRSTSWGKVANEQQVLQQALAGNYDIAVTEVDGLFAVTITGEEGPQPVAEAADRVSTRLAELRGYLNERYQEIFADYLIRDLTERLREQLRVARDLCRRMNEVLEGARSSQGVHVQLEWRPSPSLSDDVRQAIELVRIPFAERSEEQDAVLRRVFTQLIEAQRDSASGGYAELLARALDYRSWYSFNVRVRDTGPDGKPRVRRLRQLSSGETRLVSYVTLFAAAAAFYDAVSASSDGRGPLRLVLLDEAFERLDDPTIARMLGLLVDLDMDWVITWPSGWGISPKIPKMHIFDILRPSSGPGIACTHTVWNGSGLTTAES